MSTMLDAMKKRREEILKNNGNKTTSKQVIDLLESMKKDIIESFKMGAPLTDIVNYLNTECRGNFIEEEFSVIPRKKGQKVTTKVKKIPSVGLNNVRSFLKDNKIDVPPVKKRQTPGN